ncbi:MAG: hypothetical protein AB8B86_19240 [Pseudomonadales bacterium]
MRVGYTEFSYGYAFTENLINSQPGPPTRAPYFPNLQQEATLGYDIRIDLPTCPIFFQFKIPKVMVRSTAAEIKQHSLAGINVPFFRMPIMEAGVSNQHHHLLKLEQSNPNRVYYCCSTAPDIDHFNSDYLQQQMHNRSVVVAPSFVGSLPDQKKHNVVFTGLTGPIYFCSEPREIKRLSLEEAMQVIFDPPRSADSEQRGEVASVDLEEAVEKALEDVLEITRLSKVKRDSWLAYIRNRLIVAERAGPQIDFPSSLRTKIIATREIARSMLGFEFLIAQNYAQESRL